MKNKKIGEIYICPTPIGNLKDITLRTLETLEEVDLIGAEDTRRTIKLLNHYEIKTPLTSYHEHNENEKSIYLIDKIKKGENIAIVSDAGMPGISDPGERIIKKCIKENIKINVLPGATASITALISSGLKTDSFTFIGFLSSKKQERKKELEDLKLERRTLIIYESPYRILDLLKDMKSIFGDRQISLSRELTKKYEENLRGNISKIIEELENREIRGEFVLVVDGNKEKIEKEKVDIKEELRKYIKEGNSKSKSVKLVSKKHDLPKNEVYQKSLEL